MFIYNVTVNIDEEAQDEWLQWMRQVHIPDVMKSGCFVSSRILKVLHVNDTGSTYSIQYSFNEMADIERYMEKFAKRLQDEHRARYGERYTAFRTVLEEI
jgi:hypothetical protein